MWPPETSKATNGKRRRIGREERRQQVALEVVDAERRLAERRSQRAGDTGADQQRAGQARAARVGDDVDVAPSVGAGRAQDLARQRQDAADVVARSELRNDAAVVGVHLDLAVQRLREQRGVASPSASTRAMPVSSQEDSMPRTRIEEV